MTPGIGSILMLHRTAPYNEDNIIYNENMKISSEELDLLIKELKRERRVFLDLDEVVEIIRIGKKPKYKFVVITLDDGYRDNLTYGYPVFKEHRIPFCIYITNSFPNQTTNLWWYALENVILNNTILRHPDGRKLENESTYKKKQNFLTLRNDVINKYFKDPFGLFQQLGEFNFDLLRERKKMCLTWDEIKELSKDPLATMGCHTVNHYPLSKLDHREAELEIMTSKKELEVQLTKEIKHFAFPFGSKNEADEREYEIAKSIGFDSVVTTLHGHLHLTDNPLRLDRIFLSPLRNNSSLLRREMFWNLKSVVSSVRNIF
jgi:peptidoglycan/xylan/chitin deacetylase (PgdA/CDA1 family)